MSYIYSEKKRDNNQTVELPSPQLIGPSAHVLQWWKIHMSPVDDNNNNNHNNHNNHHHHTDLSRQKATRTGLNGAEALQDFNWSCVTGSGRGPNNETPVMRCNCGSGGERLLKKRRRRRRGEEDEKSLPASHSTVEATSSSRSDSRERASESQSVHVVQS